MKTSIIVPCYNHEKYVADCLESIIAQDYDNIEVIICDDASEDYSWEIIESFRDKLEQRFDRAVLMKNEKNLGLTKTLNRMLKCSTGEIIKTIASDDMLVKNCISNMVRIFRDNPEVAVVFTNGWIVDQNQRYSVQGLDNKIYKQCPKLDEDTLFERLYMKNFISAPTAGVRRNVYEILGMYDEEILIEDWEYWLRVAKEKQFRFYYDDSCRVLYRRSNGSMTSVCNNEMLEKRRNILHEAELKVINKYRENVSGYLYAKKKYEIIENEFLLAHRQQLGKTKEALRTEIKEFMKNEIRDLNYKEQVICWLKWIRRNIGKYR